MEVKIILVVHIQVTLIMLFNEVSMQHTCMAHTLESVTRHIFDAGRIRSADMLGRHES